MEAGLSESSGRTLPRSVRSARWLSYAMMLGGMNLTIYMYSGVPGAGKSAHAANEIRFQLNRRHPRPVICNFDLGPLAPVKSREWFHYYRNEELSPELLTTFADDYWKGREDDFREDHLNLVLDECQLLFNSRLWSAKDRLAWLEFFSQHRKYGYKVIFIAQSAKMVDNQFRMLIEYEYLHRKVSNLGVIGYLLGALFAGRLYMHINYYFQTSERLGMDWFLASKKDFLMYDTHARFERTA